MVYLKKGHRSAHVHSHVLVLKDPFSDEGQQQRALNCLSLDGKILVFGAFGAGPVARQFQGCTARSLKRWDLAWIPAHDQESSHSHAHGQVIEC